MIRINLLGESRAQKTKKAVAPPFLSGGQANNLILVGIVLLGLLVALGWLWRLHAKKAELEEAVRHDQAEVDRLKTIIDEVQGYEKRKADLEAKIKLINELKTNQRGPVHLMDEVSTALPDLVWLTNMEIVGNTIHLKGQALTPNAIANFLENLKKSPYFQEPKFNDMTQGGGGIYNFDMAFGFTYAPANTGAKTPAASAASGGM
jgi:type IV pilus assembly protein PilN